MNKFANLLDQLEIKSPRSKITERIVDCRIKINNLPTMLGSVRREAINTWVSFGDHSNHADWPNGGINDAYPTGVRNILQKYFAKDFKRQRN
jgi:hypothetical protein